MSIPDHPGQSAASRPGEPLAGADPSKLSKVRLGDLVVRFGFGAAISLVAGIISLAFGATAGGMFLAFPAILPATITLIGSAKSPDQVRRKRAANQITTSVRNTTRAVATIINAQRNSSAA